LRREGIPRIEVSLLRHWCNTREGVHHPARDARVTERSRLLPGHLFQSRDSASARTDAGLVRRQCGWQAGAGSHVARRSRMVLTAVASGAAASASRLGCAKSSGSTACGMGSSTGVAVFGPKSSAAACTRTHTTQGHRHSQGGPNSVPCIDTPVHEACRLPRSRSGFGAPALCDGGVMQDEPLWTVPRTGTHRGRPRGLPCRVPCRAFTVVRQKATGLPHRRR
jgi:hypothetical protein